MTNSSDLRHPAVLFATVVAAIVTAFVLIAALSPQVGLDIPGFRNCSGAECVGVRGGGD
jgi:hypothetical protein